MRLGTAQMMARVMPIAAPFGMAIVMTIAVFMLPMETTGQTLIGTVVNAKNQPVTQAQVYALETSGKRVGMAFSNASGQFRIVLPHVGAYQLRIERLGFGQQIIDVAFDSVTVYTRRFELTDAPIEIASIEGTAKRMCSQSRVSGEVAQLWDDLRKALQTVAFADDLPPITYTAVEYTRNINAYNMRYAADTAFTKLVGRHGPYLSAPVDSLFAHGFVQPDPETGGFAYYGPDAEVLLSTQFLGAYCFDEVTQKGSPDLIGLRFRRPKKDTDSLPTISGTIWADRATHELTSVEFNYEKLPVDDPDIKAHGVVEFTHIADGPWIVTRWLLRVPRFVEQPRKDGKGVDVIFLHGYRELERVVLRGDYADRKTAYVRSAPGH